MADVFLSYSRRDAEFVHRLADDLRGHGKEVFVDVDGLRDAEIFPRALQEAIEGSDAFLFVLSPHSVASRYCEQEVRHAAELNKRIVPVSLDPVPDEQVPPEIRDRNWIIAGEADSQLTDRVVDAIETDLEWERQHTRLTMRALEWNADGRRASALLRGAELTAAERWLAEGLGKDPGPTELEQTYLLTGRRAATRRQRAFAVGAVVLAAVSLVLVVFALVSRGDAVNAEKTARSQALAADSANQITIDPELSVLLGIHAVQTKATPQAMFALRAALDASPIRARLPVVRMGNCLSRGVPLGDLPFSNVPTVAFSPDGRQLAEGLCLQQEIRIAVPATGRIERVIPLGGPGDLFAYVAPRRIVVAPRGRLELVDTDQGRVLMQGPAAAPQTAPALDPRAPLVAVADASDILLWNLRDDAVRRIPLPPPAHGEVRQGLAFSPDGRRIAIANLSTTGAPPSGVTLISTTTGHVLADLQNFHGGALSGAVLAEAVAFSPDGRKLYLGGSGASSSTGAFQVLDARTLRVLHTLVTDHLNDGQSLSLSSNGQRLAYVFGDGTGGVLTPSGSRVVTFPAVSEGTARIALSPSAPIAAETSGDGQVRILHATGLEEVTIPPPAGVSPGSVGLSGFDGSYVDELNGFTNGDFQVDRWSASGEPAGSPLTVAPRSETVAAAFLSDDGRLAFVQPGDRRAVLTPEPIQIWSTAERRIIRTLPATRAPDYNTQFFLGGAFIDHDNLIAISVAAPHRTYSDELIDVRTGSVRVLQTLPCPTRSQGSQIAASPDGRRVAFVHECGPIRVFDTTTGRRLGPGVPANNANSIAISDDGRLLAAAATSGTITISRIATGKPVTALSQVHNQSYFLAFSPDGRYFAAGGQDHEVRIWDDRTWNQLRVIDQPSFVFDILFTTDSQHFDVMDDTAQIQEYDTCPDCETPVGLVGLARTRVTRSLTAAERAEFSVN